MLLCHARRPLVSWPRILYVLGIELLAILLSHTLRTLLLHGLLLVLVHVVGNFSLEILANLQNSQESSGALRQSRLSEGVALPDSNGEDVLDFPDLAKVVGRL